MPETTDNPLPPTGRRGVALLMVLLVVMAIAILSMGFLARADVELACGENMLLRVQMDQLADSALEHAKGLLLHPQDIDLSGASWSAIDQQLVWASPDYYNVTMTRDPADYCTYNVACEAYRVVDAQRAGVSRLWAQVRLDPCVALWAGADLAHRPGWSCRGDLYCAGAVANLGTIDGDVFAVALTGAASGGWRQPSQLTLPWPRVTVADFTSRYGTVVLLPGPFAHTVLGPYDPARVFYCNGDLALNGDVTVNGMLLVNGNLTITDKQNVITAAKNMPALYVTGNLTLRQADGLTITGLVVVDGNVLVGADTLNAAVTGGLFARQRIAETAVDASGCGNDALLCGQPVWNPTANPGNGALEFDGVDDHLQTLDSSTRLQLVNDYTLSLQLKPAAAQKGWAGLVARCSPDGLTNHWTVQFDQGTPKTLVVYHYNTSWSTGITLDELVADGAWHHVAIVRQGVNMTAYLDGTPHITGSMPETPLNGNGHLNIGADRTASGDFVYQGSIADVRIYNRALDVAEIYPPVNGLAGLIGHWMLDEAGSQMAVTAEPVVAAVVVWSAAGLQERWSPAADGFFRNIRREAP